MAVIIQKNQLISLNIGLSIERPIGDYYIFDLPIWTIVWARFVVAMIDGAVGVDACWVFTFFRHIYPPLVYNTST